MTTTDPDDRLLNELRTEFLRYGMVTTDPASGCPVVFANLRGYYCELDLRRSGEVTWTCVLEGESPGPARVVRMTLALLAPDAAPVPEPERELAPQDGPDGMTAAARVLDAARLTAKLADEDLGDGCATPVLRVANPAARDRGQVEVIDGTDFVWAFRVGPVGSPAPGLTAVDAVDAVVAALAVDAAAEGDAR